MSLGLAVARISVVALFGVAALFGRPCTGSLLRTAFGFASTGALQRQRGPAAASATARAAALSLRVPRAPSPPGAAESALAPPRPRRCLPLVPEMSARARRGTAGAARAAGSKSESPVPDDDVVSQLEEVESATAVLWPQKKRRSASTPQSSDAVAGAEQGNKAPKAAVTKRRKSSPEEDGGVKRTAKQAKGASANGSDTTADAKQHSGKEGEVSSAAAVSVKKEAKTKRVRSAADGLPSSPSSSPSKKRVPILPGSLTPPEGWKEVYDLVWELRLARDAPVDWAGCEVVGKGDEFHILVALMLSSQTKDQVVSDAMQALKAWPRGGLSVDSILAMTDVELDSMIAKVGFHNNKTKYIKQTAQILKDNHGGRVPQTAEELCSLPGIGPKMAYIILSAAFGIVDGIGVDTHMHRIFNVLSWVTSKTPEQTREQLEGWLPRSEWPHVNVLFVGLGQGTQQPAERHRLLRRCVDCSRPADALRLVHRIGADVSGAADKVSGETALMHAVRQGNLVAVETLVDLGVKLDLRNSEGKTALDIAKDAAQRQIEIFLVEKLGSTPRR